MRSRASLFTALFAIGLFAIPHFAQAAAIPFFGPIIPNAGDQAVCPASWGMLVVVINNIIEFMITLAIVFVAPIMIAYSGFLMVINQGNAGKLEEAKKILTNTILGIVIALSGWMIVDAFMAVLYNPSAQSGQTKLDVWSNLIKGSTANFCLPQAGSLPNAGLNQGTPPASGITVVPSGAAAGDEQSIRQQLAQAHVTINHDPCPTGSNGQGCTNVAGMQAGTVSQIIAIANSCGSGCSVMITGGTEPGHASGTYSHGNGYKVDLHPTAALDAYLESMTSVGTRTGDGPGPAWTDSCGQNQYVRESDHWDIRVLAACVPPK